ncbi:hypothetical protein HMPREF0591_2870 [Mycobacterium parascrofulaceum ATCC BAA-614]|uniref:Uncharacterized protein n=1 Tax=Mycobacterium parascrofulaceum ATCC BAA-614 TaxID=525368 RepID=D5P9M6_9MYCO|nr:hypothetical protein HMPREF0591_2870 [Mycobacterium parascrofulaceum ATCC BAA-614]
MADQGFHPSWAGGARRVGSMFVARRSPVNTASHDRANFGRRHWKGFPSYGRIARDSPGFRAVRP